MATPVIMHNTIMATLHGLQQGHEFAHVLCFRTAAAPTNAQVTDVAQNIYTVLLPRLVTVAHTSLVWYSIVAKNMHVANGFEYTQPVSVNGTGLRGGSSRGGNQAMAPLWTTTQGGRSFEGHTYFGPLSETDIEGDFSGTTLMNLLIALLNFLSNYNTPTSAHFAVGSRKLQGSTSTTGYRLTNKIKDMGRRLD